MEIHYLEKNNKIIHDKLEELFKATNENIIIINQEFAKHEINKKYTNIMIEVYYKINEINNTFKKYNMNPLTSCTYYTLMTQLIRIAETARKYLNTFVSICNLKFGRNIYEYNKIKFLLASKILDKYQSYKEVINNFNIMENLAPSAYDFLDLETDVESDYSDITVSFTCGLIKEELEQFGLSDQTYMIDEI
jgi:hypothetical protein